MLKLHFNVILRVPFNHLNLQLLIKKILLCLSTSYYRVMTFVTLNHLVPFVLRLFCMVTWVHTLSVETIIGCSNVQSGAKLVKGAGGAFALGDALRGCNWVCGWRTSPFGLWAFVLGDRMSSFPHVQCTGPLLSLSGIPPEQGQAGIAGVCKQEVAAEDQQHFDATKDFKILLLIISKF